MSALLFELITSEGSSNSDGGISVDPEGRLSAGGEGKAPRTAIFRLLQQGRPLYAEFTLRPAGTQQAETAGAAAPSRKSKKSGGKASSSAGNFVVGVAFASSSRSNPQSILAALPGHTAGTEGFSSRDGQLTSKKVGAAPSVEPNSVSLCAPFHPSSSATSEPIVVGCGVMPSNPKNPSEGNARFITLNGAALAQKLLAPPHDRPEDCDLLIALQGKGFSVSANVEGPFLFSEANTAVFQFQRQLQESARAAQQEADADESEDEPASPGSPGNRTSGKKGRKQTKKGKKAKPKKANKKTASAGGESAAEAEFVPAPPRRTVASVIGAFFLLGLIALLFWFFASRHDPDVAKKLGELDQKVFMPIAGGESFSSFFARLVSWPGKLLRDVTTR